MKDTVSEDLINYSFPKKGKFRPVIGHNKIEVILDENFNWKCEFNGKKIYGSISENTIEDLIGFGVIPEKDDPKFKDALKLYIARGLLQFKTTDWDDGI